MREMSRRHIDESTVIKVEFKGKEFHVVVDVDATSNIIKILRDFFELPPCCVYHRLVGLNGKPCAGINEAWEASLQVKTCIVSADGRQEIQGIDLRGKRYGLMSQMQ
jgi:hypothetical protein